jgi:predicted dehydrogenase
MSEVLGAGILGCGNISAAYLRLAPLFKGFEMRACADISMEAASARAAEFGIRAETVDGLLAADDIDIIVNLTIPAAHFETSTAILNAGKHVWSEKPFVLSLEEGAALARLAVSRDLRIGSAPDTWLGGAHQQARALIDAGEIGVVTSGTAHFMSSGMEHWHPNPDFFYLPGAGPVFDMAPYYLTNLVQLIGPVKRVAAMSATPQAERLISSQPRAGEFVPVGTPTTFHSLLEFQSGAIITLASSWDVIGHGHGHMELYGGRGTMDIPDPNLFGGEVSVAGREGARVLSQDWDHPFSVINQAAGGGANYRSAGLADMSLAIAQGRPHRCALDVALHVVDVMASILKSAETGSFVGISSACERPEALGPDAARALMA